MKQTPLTCVSSIYPRGTEEPQFLRAWCLCSALFAEMEKQPTQFSG